MYKDRIYTLSILGAGTCNLACKYCFLCGLKEHKKWDNEIIEAVKDGSYLRTIIDIFKKTRNDPAYVREIKFWGGESTLHLSLWKEYFPEWMHTFYNITQIGFVSNGTYDPYELADFIRMVNANAENHIDFNIQISSDGPDCYQKDWRGVSSDVLFEKAKILLEELGKDFLPNITFIADFKPTFPIEVFNNINKSLDSAMEYWNWWFDHLNYVNSIPMPRCVGQIGMKPGIITMLYNYTQQDGIDLAHSLRVSDMINWEKLNRNSFVKIDPEYSANVMSGFYDGWMNITHQNAPLGYCGQVIREWLIRPDGIVSGCLAGLYNDKFEYIEHAKKVDYDEYLNTKRVHSSYFFDPLNMTEEEIDRFNYRNKVMDDQANNFYVSTAASQLYELALVSQASPIYLSNSEVLIRHAYLLGKKTNCYYNMMRKTGIPYTGTLGLARLYGNGAFQYLEEKRRHYI